MPGGAGSGGAGSGGSAPNGGMAGAAGAGGSAGASGSGNVNPGKGASGQAVCTGLSGFVDPTTGMGEVKEVTAPQGSFFAFIEGPVWVATTKQLLFSDNAGSPERIWSFDPMSMMLTKALEDSGSNGLAVDSDDQVIVADQKNRAIYRWDSATKMKVGANIASGSFKPNDLVVRSDGGVYFTDPDSGLYYIAPGTSEAKKASSKVSRPNGLVLTLDEKALIVGDVGNQSLSKFELGADGSVVDATAPFGTTMGTTADGMCVDCAGNVYVGTQSGVEIFDPTGKRLGAVPTGESSNCTFGGADRKTLFVTSRATLKVVTMANPGLPD
jgi:gluconolactonase